MKYAIEKNYGNTNFITGMRAFAALAVIMIHAGGAGFRELGEIGKNVANFGAAGVFVFFVISGFSDPYPTKRRIVIEVISVNGSGGSYLFITSG